MHAPPDSETAFNLETFVDGHRATFPRVVRVAEGFWADSAEETLEHGQVLILHEVQQQHFVVVTQTDGVDLCIPRKCPVKVELVPLNRLNDEYSTVEELFMAQLEYFRVLDDMPSFHIKGGSVMKINQRQDDSNHLGCEPLSHDGTQEVVNLPFTEQGRFQPLHNGMEYFLEEVIEQYPLPSKVGVRLVNDFRLPLKSTLPWGVGLRLQKDFQDETIIATVVGGEGEGDVLLFPKTLDLTVIPDLNRAVRNGEELTESCQLSRMSSVHRLALLGAVRAFSVKSPVRTFNLECLTPPPPPLTKPCKSEAVPRTNSFNPKTTNKTLDANGMTSANSCHPSLRQTNIVEDSSRPSASLGCLLPGGTNQTFNCDPEILPMESKMAQTETANDSSITPALPEKKNEYGARGQTLPSGNRNTPCRSRQGTSIHRSVKPKQKLKLTDQAQFDYCEGDVASGNTSRFTPPLPRKQNGTRGLTLPNTFKREEYNLKKQICYRIGPGETRKEAILSTSQTMTQQPLRKPRKSTSPFATENNRYPVASLVPKNVTKSMDGQNVNVSETSISGTDLSSEPPQTNFAFQTSRLSGINVNSQTYEVEATKERLTLGISAPFVTMEQTLHHGCTKKLGPGPAQQRESSQNQAEQDFLSYGNTFSSESIMCSSTSVDAQVSSGVILNESVFDVASSQWTHPFKELVSLPNCAERGRELIPCRLRQVSPHYVNHSPFSQTLPTNGVVSTSTLKPPSPPYVNCDQRSFQFRNEDSAIRIGEKSATPRNPHFQMNGDDCRRPIPDSTLKSSSPPYVNYDPRSFHLRSEDSANRIKKSATLEHSQFQLDCDNRTRPIPGSASESLSPPYVNYDPRSFQFRNEDRANVVKKSATLGHSHFQVDGSNCTRPILDSALKSLTFPYVNCNPRSSQFRNDDSANRIEKSATLGHSHFQMDEDSRTRPNPDSSKLPGVFRNVHVSLKDKQGPDDSSSYRKVLPGPKNGIDSTSPFENGEDENVHNGAYVCTMVHYGDTLQPNKASQRKIDQGTQTEGMSCPDQAQNILSPYTLIRSDLNRDFEDLHVLNLYIDMRAQLTLQQEQHDAEVHLLKAETERLAAELKRIQNAEKNVRQKYTKGCQTVDGTVLSKDSGAIRASTVPKPESVSGRANCHTYENNPRLNGRNATTQNARSVIYRTTTTAERPQENKKPLPMPRTMNVFVAQELTNNMQ